MKNETNLKKGDPAPYDGILITHQLYNKFLNDKKLLNWVSNQLKKYNLE